MDGWHIAQLNVGRAVTDLDDPRMAGFMDHLTEINSLGASSPGFVWQALGAAGDSTQLRVAGDSRFDDPRFIVNLTVWRSVDELHAFAYRSAHASYYARRREWFERPGAATLVLWWVPAGEVPDLAEAMRRLDLLNATGPTPEAFTFKRRFDPPAEEGTSPGNTSPVC